MHPTTFNALTRSPAAQPARHLLLNTSNLHQPQAHQLQPLYFSGLVHNCLAPNCLAPQNIRLTVSTTNFLHDILPMSIHHTHNMCVEQLTLALGVESASRMADHDKPYLDFSRHQIDDAAAMSLVHTIRISTKPLNLDLNLADNWITDKGAIALADAIRNKYDDIISMEINLSSNFIGDDGATALANAIANAPPNMMGIDIHLNENFISTDGLNELQKAATRSAVKRCELAIELASSLSQ